MWLPMKPHLLIRYLPKLLLSTFFFITVVNNFEHSDIKLLIQIIDLQVIISILVYVSFIHMEWYIIKITIIIFCFLDYFFLTTFPAPSKQDIPWLVLSSPLTLITPPAAAVSKAFFGTEKLQSFCAQNFSFW